MDIAMSRSETARSLAPTDTATAHQASCGQITVQQTDDGTDNGTDDGQNDGQDGTSGQSFLDNVSSRTILLAAGGTTLAIIVLAVLLRL